jgi:hypothetical protein
MSGIATLKTIHMLATISGTNVHSIAVKYGAGEMATMIADLNVGAPCITNKDASDALKAVMIQYLSQH